MECLVSVVIPTYNRSSFLKRAILSVLAQSYKSYEIIVVDDGSVDDTKEIVTKYFSNINYLWQSNQGAASARNHGIAASKGKYIAFLDSDDEWAFDKLHKQVEIIKSSDCSLVLCDCIYVDSSGAELGRSQRRQQFPSDGQIYSDVLLAPYLIPSTVLVMKQALDKSGYFNTSLKTAEDVDIFIRLAANEKIVLLEESLVRYTRGHDGLGDSLSSYDDYLSVMISHLGEDNERVSHGLRKHCLFNCYSTFIKGKTWHKEYLAAFMKIYSMLLNISNCDDLFKSCHLVASLGFNFVKSKIYGNRING